LDHARAERALADRALITAALSAEETIEEIIERIVIITAPTAVRRIGRRTPPAYCRLNRGFGIDIYNAWFQLFADLRKRIGKLLWRRHGQLCGVGTLVVLLAFNAK